MLYSEALGAETLVHVRLQSGDLATIRQDGSLTAPAEGDGVGLGWNAVDEMLFGPNGHRLQ